INAELIRECREELLVSKKTSDKDSEYFRDDHRSLPSETMLPEPPVGPFIPVEDSHIQEDEQTVFSPQPMIEPAIYRRSSKKKKRFYRSPIAIAFILIVGFAAGYFFYSNDKNTAESFAISAQQEAKKYLSDKAGSKNDKPPMVPAPTETSDIPSSVEAGNVGDSRYFMVKSPNSSLLKETIPKETDTPQGIPSKQFSEENGVQTYTTKPGGPESDGNNKTMEVNTAGASNVSPENSLETGSPKEMALATTKPVDTVPSNLKQKVPVIVPVTEKTSDKIQTLASRPVQVHTKPKTPETIKTKAVKPVEKPETVKSITKPVQAQKKTSEKQAITLAAIPLVNPSKETVISKKDLPGEDKIVSKKKAQPALPVPDEKKAVNRADEKIVSLSVPASKSETAGKAGFAHYNLHARLKAFLNEYCRTYEQKDLDKFSTFFASNALEKGKPFRFWLSKYRQNFNRIDSMEYDIELERYATQEETGLVKINGLFHVRAKLGGSKEWRKGSGQISMLLEADGNSFKVRQLDY
ncbi:MAG: hypothetical protein MUO88_12175, partial [Desulfobacterales bacterium]|nr:hypothetical protein [Desulfobacterales bacterium]